VKAHIVIGANFGDEGKGQVTEYLCRQLSDTIVVRHNGGAQAAHTVVSEDGSRHVFHHFGSGTLVDTTTFLSEFFIVNPRAFFEELTTLKGKGVSPRVMCHRDALLTTPYDWHLNWKVEEKRGMSNRHGSCGMGINETVERCSRGLQTTVNDLFDIDNLKKKLEMIRDEYIFTRGEELDVAVEDLTTYTMEHYLADCEEMARLIVPVSTYNLLKTYENVIFEGAQGLLLDEHHYLFPHVTRSKTGSNNAVQILKEININRANVYYVTRTYLTRHGNGPLPFEGEIPEREDITNKPNPYQGTLRFAPLNIDLLEESILDDLAVDFDLIPSLAVTWASNSMIEPFVTGGEMYENDLIPEFDSITNFEKKILFYTPQSVSDRIC
jgi:adenylosuccinate synthase